MPNWKKVIVSGSNAALNNITASGHLTALNGGFIAESADVGTTILEVEGTISASGPLFANIPDSSNTSYLTVMYDPTTGQLHRTGSYGGGGGTGDPGTVVVANPGGSPGTALTSITIDGNDFSIAGQDDDWGIRTDTAGSDYFSVETSRNVIITGSSTSPSARPSLIVKRGNSSANGSILRLTDSNNVNLFEVLDSSTGDLFAINDSSGQPIFSVNDGGNITVDGNLKLGNTSGTGIEYVSSNDDLGELSSPGNCRGEIIKIGDTDTDPGKVYAYVSAVDGWQLANNASTAHRGALLAIATGNNSADGMLIRGMAAIDQTIAVGGTYQVYMGTNGLVTVDVPDDGNAIRSLGHVITANIMFFNPSPDFIIVNP